MEFVDGEDLSRIIDGSRRSAPGSRRSDSQRPGAKSQEPIRGLPLSEAIPLARQIADALEAAHEQGIIHRDLKPHGADADHRRPRLGRGTARVVQQAVDASLRRGPRHARCVVITGASGGLGEARLSRREGLGTRPASSR